MKKQAKKNSILDTALQCIKKHGVQDTTVRTITEKAGVNTASINYYFGSKDHLIEEALDQHFESLLVDWEVIMERQAMNFKQGLQTLLRDVMQETQENPNLMKAHLYDPLLYNRTDGPFATRFDKFLQFLLEQKRKAQPGKSDQVHQLEIMQLFSGVLFTGLLHGLFEQFDEWDFDNRESRQAYIEEMIQRIVEE